ncbi:unnamed protein product [Nippostrongylus brasiliensis]|uniref:LSDAT_euk domain-containing protein n=1 Tax=Nippostrongylus brasiliensis TaxID=27835 RepID=A0A0N4XJP9_NIPBR|nr:unnamed protein product [Nippostrongylus brasiliensis]
MMTAPKHVHGGDWKDMLHLTNFGQKKKGGNAWIEHKIKKRECSRFVPSLKYSSRCGCGMAFDQHPTEAKKPLQSHRFLTVRGDDETTNDSDCQDTSKNGGRKSGVRWTIGKNTETSPTDAYGTIIFEGCAHQSRAQYVRTSFDTDPAALSHLFYSVWKLPPPKLVITIHGGLTNFE